VQTDLVCQIVPVVIGLLAWYGIRFFIHIFANVPDHLLPLAFGADPAAAGCVTKVPKAW
jgi:hypothetical protein